MTPENLQRLNDLRMRVRLADEAERAGDTDRARTLMPSDAEIVEALRLARDDRLQALKSKIAKSETKAATQKFSTLSLDELFG